MKVDYGVRTLVFLALRTTGRYVPASEIARSQHIPEPYLLRVCSELQKAGLIESRRGPSGGHKLARPAEQITVADVVTSLDHSLAPTDCVEEPGRMQALRRLFAARYVGGRGEDARGPPE